MMDYCNAKTRSGGKCQQKAGWGTDHVGSGRCKLHGGSTKRGVEHPNYQHGRYAKYMPESIRDKAREFQEQPNPTDLLSELALIRGMLAEFLSRYESMKLDSGGIEIVRSLSDDIRKYVDTIVKLRNQTALTAAELAFIAARIPEIVQRYIHDPDAQRRFIIELLSITGHDASRVEQLAEGQQFND